MKCPYCEREVQPRNMDKHINTKYCRGIRRLKTILEGDYEDIFINEGYDRFFSNLCYDTKTEILGELTEEEYEFRFLRTRTEEDLSEEDLSEEDLSEEDLSEEDLSEEDWT